MKTIEEAAEEYMQREIDATFEDGKNHELDKVCSFHELEVAFFYGAKWALKNQWHDIRKGDYPFNYKELIGKKGHTIGVICVNELGFRFLDYMERDANCNIGWSWADDNLPYLYWMPIPNIPKELKKQPPLF